MVDESKGGGEFGWWGTDVVYAEEIVEGYIRKVKGREVLCAESEIGTRGLDEADCGVLWGEIRVRDRRGA